MFNSIFLFGSLALLFLIVSFMVKDKFKFPVIILNLIFLLISYYDVGKILGVPLPLEYNIPFYEKISLNDTPIWGWGVSADEKKMYFIVGIDSPKLIETNFDKDFFKRITDIDGSSPDGLVNRILLNDPLNSDINAPKKLLKSIPFEKNGNVQTYRLP